MSNLKLRKHISLFFSAILMVCVTNACSNNSTLKTSMSNDEVNNFLVQNHANVDINKDCYDDGS